MAAADALIAMTAQCRGAASDDGIEHLAMRPCKMRLLLFPESIARSTDDVGHLEGGSAHRLIFLLERFTSSGQDTSMAVRPSMVPGNGYAWYWRICSEPRRSGEQRKYFAKSSTA
jgi:hypothetical protein